MMKTPLAIVAIYIMVAAYGLTITIHEYTPGNIQFQFNLHLRIILHCLYSLCLPRNSFL